MSNKLSVLRFLFNRTANSQMVKQVHPDESAVGQLLEVWQLHGLGEEHTMVVPRYRYERGGRQHGNALARLARFDE